MTRGVAPRPTPVPTPGALPETTPDPPPDTTPGAGAEGAGRAGTAAVILAAGAGSRFSGGTHKLLAPFHGRPLLLWSVQAAQDAGLAAVCVVTGAAEVDSLLPSGVDVLCNDRWSSGLASSLLAGVAWCAQRGYEAAVVGLADQPLVPAAAWRAVAGEHGSPIVVASYGGRRRNPVRLHRSIWPLLPRSGDEGARVLMQAHPDLVVEVPCAGEPADLDTVEDFARWS